MTQAHHELSDPELLDAHNHGDPDAFGVLFARHRDRLWAVALRTTGNPEDAADALQEALISAFRRAGDFRGDAQVTTWLHRVVVNASLDRLRRNAVRAARPLPDDLEEYAGRGAVLGTDPTVDPAEQAVVADERAAVLAALDRLPAEQKAALVLVDLEGHPVEAAARMLDCPVGTVKSRCARGRRRMLGLLEESGITRPGSPNRGTPATPDASDPGPSTTPPGSRSEPQGGARR